MENIDKWDLLVNWHLVLPPSRPSSLQLRNIHHLIQGMDRTTPVAILGSTPEFRDLLHESGFTRIYVFDKNRQFFQTTSKLRIHRNEEVFVSGDWLDTLKEHRSMFALVLSDLTSGNVHYDSWSDFYESVGDTLADGGFFVDKILIHEGPNLNFSGLIEKYSQMPLNLLTANHFSCEMLFCSTLLDKEELVDTAKFYKYLSDEVKNKRVRAITELAKLVTPPDCIWYYGRKWKDLEKNYCPQLSKLAEFPDDPGNPYYGRLHHNVFVKRR